MVARTKAATMIPKNRARRTKTKKQEEDEEDGGMAAGVEGMEAR